MPFQIIRNDITKVHADAIVNSANPRPVYGSGTDSAVYQAAGAEKLLAERKKIGPIPRGEVAVTPAFDLPAKYIIHTVGPVWEDGTHKELEQLASCYRKSLLIAKQLGCESIAFPLISTGVYGFPKDRALAVALETIADFLDDNDNEMEITLVVFDKRAFDLSAALTADVSQFIDDHYVEQKHEEEYAYARPSVGAGEYARKNFRQRMLDERRRRRKAEALRREEELQEELWEEELLEADEGLMMPSAAQEAPAMAPSSAKKAPKSPAAPAVKADRAEAPQQAPKKDPWSKKKKTLDDILAGTGESFRDCLFRLIDERGLKDPTVYKRANVDRKVFSKIRKNEDYLPKKGTALAFAIALELNLDQTKDLIGKAGLALSDSNKTDLIIEYCIENRIYNIFDVNALLFKYDQPSIGAYSL
ncbi:MAG: macro domain-containing protein [Lachnospiraceae bacterium]|nr:macro domain-containing protein [Lachnospiraceae bacterium]